MSLRDQIFAKPGLPKRSLTVAEWGVTVEVRGMTGTQRADFVDYVAASNASKADDKSAVDLREFFPRLVLGHVYDPDGGAKVFADDDGPRVLELAANVLEEIAKAVLELSGLDEGAEARAVKKSPGSEAETGKAASI